MRFYITDGVLCTEPPHDASRCQGSFDVPDDARHIDLPEGVLFTGNVRFRLFPELRTVSLPNSLEAINARAFEQCTNLTHINLPEGLRYIGTFAFASCTRLTELHIPEGTSFPGDLCFAGCVNLRELFISRRQLRYKKAFRFCRFLTVPAFDAVPADLRRACVMGFAGHEALYSDVLQKKYKTHLRKNASAYCKAAFSHPPLLRLLCREALIKPQYIDQYVFHALKCGNVELTSLMLEYAAAHRKDTLCLDTIE